MNDLTGAYDGTEIKTSEGPVPLVIRKDGCDLFELRADGGFYVRGELVTDDAAIVQGLRDTLAVVVEASR